MSVTVQSLPSPSEFALDRFVQIKQIIALNPGLLVSFLNGISLATTPVPELRVRISGANNLEVRKENP